MRSEGFLALFNQRLQVETPVLLIESILGDIFTDLPGIEFGMVRRLPIVELSQFDRLIQCISDLHTEPGVDAVGKKVDGNDKEGHGRDQRQPDKGGYKPCPEL